MKDDKNFSEEIEEIESENKRRENNGSCPKCKHKHRRDGSCTCGCKMSN